MYELNHKGTKPIPPIVDGRQSYTFKPTETKEVVSFIHDNAIGDYLFKQVQIELGNQFTAYSQNTTTESMMGAVFRGVTELQQFVTDEDGNWTKKITETLYKTVTEYRNILDGTSMKNMESDEGIYQMIENMTNMTVNEYVAKSDLFSRRIQQLMTDETGEQGIIGSQWTQTADKISLALFKDNTAISRILLGHQGISLNGALIDLDGNVTMNEAYLTNLYSNTVNTGVLTANQGRVGHLIAGQLDVNYLSGDFAQFVRMLFDGKKSKVMIDSTGMHVLRNDGTYSTRFTDNGIEIWRNGIWIGSVSSLDAVDTSGYYQGLKSMTLSTRPGSYLSLSYYHEDHGKHYRALALGGDGRLRLHSPFYAGTTNSGFSIAQARVNGNVASSLIDVESSGGIYVTRDKEVWFSARSGYVYSITSIIEDIKTLKSSINSIRTQVNNMGSTTISAPETKTDTNTAKDTEAVSNTTTFRVGDRVTLKAGTTHYYTHYETRVPIASGYGTKTYTIGSITPVMVAPYRLDLGGTVIAWATASMMVKV